MPVIASATYSSTGAPPLSWAATAEPLLVQPLRDEQASEVLSFLSARPLHTVALCGLIYDNGLVSELNRGEFYGCRNSAGQLEGVALIGHATLMETRTSRALEAFAKLAQQCTRTHMMLGEQKRMEEFWGYYDGNGQAMRFACRELLFEQVLPRQTDNTAVPGLRLATLDDLDLVAPVQARMAFEESGINPLDRDAEGFRKRCARRIEQGRVWVSTAQGRLLFKADVISDTPACIYLEGIWVNPEEREKGYGLRCLSQLSSTLLTGTNSICLLVNEQNTEAHALYRKAGFELRDYYDTIFLERF